MSRSASAPLSLIRFLADVLEVLLALRFILALFGAHPANWFSQAVYRMTDPFVAPFRGIFPNTDYAAGALEWSTIVAMVVYALAASVLIRLILLLADIIVHAEYAGATHRHS